MSGDLKDVQGGEREAALYQFQCREIGESDWASCDFGWYQYCQKSPEHDTRVVEVTAQQGAMPDAGSDLEKVLCCGDATHDEQEEAAHHIRLLANALGECVQAAGITAAGAALDGPQLLMFADDLKEMLAAPSPARLNPQPCAVVLPPRMSAFSDDFPERHTAARWYNQALDDAARLNPPADGVVVSRELLDKVRDLLDMRAEFDPTYPPDTHAVNDDAKLLIELRALLAQQPAPSPVSGLVEALEKIAAGCSCEVTTDALDQLIAAYKAQGGDV